MAAIRVNDGHTTIVTAGTAGISAGAVYVIGEGTIGIAPYPIAAGEQGAVELTGTYFVDKVTADNFTAGAEVYYNATSAKFTVTSPGSGSKTCAVVLEAAGTTSSTAKVKIG